MTCYVWAESHLLIRMKRMSSYVRKCMVSDGQVALRNKLLTKMSEVD
jgi:hypothetical protein